MGANATAAPEYRGDVQAHDATDAELVEGGQLFALHVPPGKNT